MALIEIHEAFESEIGEILFTEEEIGAKVRELGAQITADFKNIATPEKPLIVLGVLKGVLIFLADLLRELDLPVEVHFVDVDDAKAANSRYQQLPGRLDEAIRGNHVLFVEDIVDAGLTLSFVTRFLWQSEPESVSVCTLLNKEANRMMSVDIQYVGFEIDPIFVVGYGLDHNEQYRNLRYIGVLKK